MVTAAVAVGLTGCGNMSTGNDLDIIPALGLIYSDKVDPRAKI